MKTTTAIYSVSHSDGTFYVPSLVEAMAHGRRLRKEPEEGDFVSVTKLVIDGNFNRRDLYCRLLNGEGFAAHQEEVPLD